MNDLIKFGLSADIKLISVAGIGSYGTGAVNYMKENGLSGIDFFQLNSNQSSEDIVKTIESIKNQWFNKLVFIVADINEESERELFLRLGGIVKELERINIGLLTIPFSIGNIENGMQSREKISFFKNNVDQLLVISSEHIFYYPNKTSVEENFFKTYYIVMLTVKTIQHALSGRSAISIDFWDIRSLSFKEGYGTVITAIAFGENRYLMALEMALNSLKNSKIINEAQNFLLYLTYGTEEVTIGEIHDLMDYFMTKISLSADVLWSTGYDHELGENVQVTVIVAGLELDSIEF